MCSDRGGDREPGGIGGARARYQVRKTIHRGGGQQAGPVPTPLGPTSPTPLPPVEVAPRSSRPGRAPRLPDRCCADCQAPQPLQPQGYAPTAAPLFSRLFLQPGEPRPLPPSSGQGSGGQHSCCSA